VARTNVHVPTGALWSSRTRRTKYPKRTPCCAPAGLWALIGEGLVGPLISKGGSFDEGGGGTDGVRIWQFCQHWLAELPGRDRCYPPPFIPSSRSNSPLVATRTRTRTRNSQPMSACRAALQSEERRTQRGGQLQLPTGRSPVVELATP
jgi:hypothetical protein